MDDDEDCDDDMGDKISRQRHEADLISQRAMTSLLSKVGQDLNSPPTLIQVTVLKRPNSVITKLPSQLEESTALLLRLEQAFLIHHGNILTFEEGEIIKENVNQRLGEMSTLLVTRFGKKDLDKSRLWKIWRERCPEKELERVALLCYVA
mmetsp:Transcript_38947/g.47460  ORF Transcript_38947/g.47460 Transcript_38947/m.47460 type:complete len:150 (+) Transcript_38947:238-687(+)